jgi:hypothetical protein
MADILLHIGLNKTGTSSIQDFMNMNAAALLEQGICYPRAGREKTAHHALSKWIKANKNDADALNAPVVESLLNEIEGARLSVLSSEDFHTLSPKGVEMLAAIFKGHRIRVVIYVREHVNYLASWYQQNVQGTHTSLAFDTFCYYNRKPLHMIVDQWAEVFGRKNVSARVYDRAQLVGGDIVQDFLEVVGHSVATAKLQRKPFESNPSVSGNLLFAKRVINNFCTKTQAASYVEEVAALSKLKPRFSGHMRVEADQVDAIGKAYKIDRRVLQRRYGATITEVSGVRDGHATPDFDTLAEDWALVMATAAERGMAIARASRILSLGNFSGWPEGAAS